MSQIQAMVANLTVKVAQETDATKAVVLLVHGLQTQLQDALDAVKTQVEDPAVLSELQAAIDSIGTNSQTLANAAMQGTPQAPQDTSGTTQPVVS